MSEDPFKENGPLNIQNGADSNSKLLGYACFTHSGIVAKSHSGNASHDQISAPAINASILSSLDKIVDRQR